MPDDHLTDSVRSYVSRVAGRPVVDVTELPGSVANRDYRVQLVDRSRLLVKIGPAAEMAKEAWACRLLGRLGLPVPGVAHLDLDGGIAGRPTLALTFLRGEESVDVGVLRQAGRVFRRVHAQHLQGWGPVHVSSTGSGPSARGRYDSWHAALRSQLAGLAHLVEAGILDRRTSAAAHDSVLVPGLIDYSGPGVLLHNDLKPAHLFAVQESGSWELSGVIDWGDATVGDPRADLARLSMTGDDELRAFAAGYGIEVTSELLDVLTRYRIAWNVAALTYEHDAGGDWFDVYRRRLTDDLDHLETTG